MLIIDDLGHRLREGRAVVALAGKLNLAVLPHTPHGPALAQEGYKAGKEIMLHAPMSNLAGMPLGQGGLTKTLSRATFESRLNKALQNVPHVRGINNHMGSELTQLRAQMSWLMQSLREQGLYFVDSRTSAGTVAAQTATDFGVPNLSRKVFLDNDVEAGAIEENFQRLVSMVEEEGLAVGIGHPYPQTIRFLEKALPVLACRGIRLAHVSEVLPNIGAVVPPPSLTGTGPFSKPDFDAPLGHVCFGLGYSVFPEMKNAGGKHCVSTTKNNAVDQVIEVANTP